jgi:hypothetical protein
MPTPITADKATVEAHCQLHKHLLWINIEASSLRLSCRVALEQLSPLDAAPRHDAVLDDETLAKFRSVNSEGVVLNGAMTDLLRSLDALWSAERRLKSVFHGSKRVKTADRLCRHRAEAEALLVAFDELIDEPPPNQPHMIRQRSMQALICAADIVLEKVETLRTQLDEKLLAKHIDDQWQKQVADLYRLRSALRRWRDNPSQKMTCNLTRARAQSESIANGLEALRDATLLHCQRMGVKFFNRAGPVPMPTD